MLLPAVQVVREAARRTSCLNKMKQIVVATHNFESTYGHLPYATRDRIEGDNGDTWMTGHIQILPYIEKDDIARRWDPQESRDSTHDNDGDGTTNLSLTQTDIPTFLCPTMDRPSAPLRENRAPASYLFSAGTQEVSLLHYAIFYGIPEPRYDGAIIPTRFDQRDATSPNYQIQTGFGNFGDGVSNTFLLGETDFKPKGIPSTSYGGVWAFGYLGYSWGTTYHPFNRHDNTSTVYGAFRSEHPGGANFALCDGAVQFVSQSINKELYDGYATRNGGENLKELY